MKIKEIQINIKTINQEILNWLEDASKIVQIELPDMSTKVHFESYFYKNRIIGNLQSNEFKEIHKLNENQLRSYQMYIHRSMVALQTIFYTFNYIFKTKMIPLLFNVIKSFLSKAFFNVGDPLIELEKMKENYEMKLFVFFHSESIDDWFIQTEELLTKFEYNSSQLIQIINTKGKTKSNEVTNLIITYRQLLSFMDKFLFLFGKKIISQLI